jgi:DtxR family Mn-dependent transcriptional regulator
VFLVEKLQFNWDQVHEVAEQLEHIKSTLLIDKLDAFLEYPKNDPHGWPIPDKNGKWYKQTTIPLSDLLINTKVRLIKVEGNEGLLKHLDELKINIGSDIEIVSKRDFDGLLEVKVNHNTQEFISKNVAECLYVQANEA